MVQIFYYFLVFVNSSLQFFLQEKCFWIWCGNLKPNKGVPLPPKT